MTERKRTAEADLAAVQERFEYNPATGDVTWKRSSARARAGSVAGGQDGQGYLRVGIRVSGLGLIYLRLHRVAWALAYGKWPEFEIDHINGDRADNRLGNLRDVTTRTNQENRRKAKCNNKSSGLLGVSLDRSANQWRATIWTNGKCIYIGQYKTAEAAHAAYLDAKRRLHAGNTL